MSKVYGVSFKHPTQNIKGQAAVAANDPEDAIVLFKSIFEERFHCDPAKFWTGVSFEVGIAKRGSFFHFAVTS